MLGLMAMLSAQNLHGNPSLFSRIFKPRAFDTAAHARAPSAVVVEQRFHGEVSSTPSNHSAKEMRKLKVKMPEVKPAEPAKNLQLERREVSQKRGQRYDVAGNSLQEGLVMVSAMYRELRSNAAGAEEP